MQLENLMGGIIRRKKTEENTSSEIPKDELLLEPRTDGRMVIKGRVKGGHELELFLVDPSSGEVVGTLAGRSLEPEEARRMWGQYYPEISRSSGEQTSAN